jgi:hypothetical protein
MIRALSSVRRQGYSPIFLTLKTKLMPAYFLEKKRSSTMKSRKLNLLLILILVIPWDYSVHSITQIISLYWQSQPKKNIYWEFNFEVSLMSILRVSRLTSQFLHLKDQVQENLIIMSRQWVVKPLRVCMRLRKQVKSRPAIRKHISLSRIKNL